MERRLEKAFFEVPETGVDHSHFEYFKFRFDPSSQRFPGQGNQELRRIDEDVLAHVDRPRIKGDKLRLKSQGLKPLFYREIATGDTACRQADESIRLTPDPI